MKSPRVTVVIIFLNGEEFLPEAIESVLAQTYRSFELVLVDDGSTDNSTRIARDYETANPGRVHYIEHAGHRNRGMSASRNAGVARGSGELVAYLDADDAWLPEKLADQVAIMDAHPEVDMVAGAANYWRSWNGGQDEVIHCGPVHDRPIHPPEAMLGIYPFGNAEAPCPSTFLVRRSGLDAIGGFEESFRGMYEDQAFLAKAYLKLVIYFPSTWWLNYRQHERSCSSEIEREGKMTLVRADFADWFADYLRKEGVRDRRVLRAARRNRRNVKIAHAMRIPMRLLVQSRTFRRVRRQYWRLTAKPVRMVG